jgi:hypothetical protein
MDRVPALLVTLAAALSAGCNEGQSNAGGSPGLEFVPGQGSAGQLNDEQADIARLAIDALAAFLAIPADRILIDTIRSVDWPDSSIGCPQPGEAYLQVVTPGHKITLRADGQIHVVHEARGHAFVCVRAKAPAAVVTPRYELVFGEQLAFARKDLAGRLGVAEGDIKAASAEEATWADASLGCPEPGVAHAQVATQGWVLKLKHGARDYIYHTDLKRTIPCPPIATD